VSSALPAEVWAQGRMKSFVARMKELVPDATFINDETNALNTTLDPAVTYDTAKAFIQGNPGVELILNTDIGDHRIAQAIVDLGREGEVFVIGWNPGAENLAMIERGVELFTMDQNIEGQGRYATVACATFAATGEILPNELTLTPVLKEDVAAYREKLDALAAG
jgi:ABC-type sugar transport system substrate-binding protein